MADKRWTVVVVPHSAGVSRSLAVSRRALQWVTGTAAVLSVAALVFGYVTLNRGVDLAQLDRLEKRNDLLRQELDQANTLIASLTDTVSAIAQRDRQIRLLAGLEPVDPDVQRAGIGGPTGAWTEREQLLAEGPVGRRALATRTDLDALMRQASLLASSFQQAVEGLSAHVDLMQRTPSITPVSPTSGWLTSNFTRARMHPIYNEARPHEGIDIFAPAGTPIQAPASGRVIDVRRDKGYGNIVTIDHGNGLRTRYAHCSKILVRIGQWVRRNENIALVGSTGIATGPHLHYEVLVNGQPQNPLNYIFPDQIVVD
jgi:murein DD-endopeptidase MepM/ murein hydrolase activator NlpD